MFGGSRLGLHFLSNGFSFHYLGFRLSLWFLDGRGFSLCFLNGGWFELGSRSFGGRLSLGLSKVKHGGLSRYFFCG